MQVEYSTGDSDELKDWTELSVSSVVYRLQISKDSHRFHIAVPKNKLYQIKRLLEESGVFDIWSFGPRLEVYQKGPFDLFEIWGVPPTCSICTDRFERIWVHLDKSGVEYLCEYHCNIAKLCTALQNRENDSINTSSNAMPK